MGKVLNYSDYKKTKNPAIDDKTVSLDDHIGYCKNHDTVYHSFACPHCTNGTKSQIDKLLDQLEDELYFQGFKKEPSQSTTKAINEVKNEQKK